MISYIICSLTIKKNIAKSEIDANFSGTTCVMLFMLGHKLICSNVGDSRCIMITDKEVIPLSIDQKPNTEGEMQRIVKLEEKCHSMKKME